MSERLAPLEREPVSVHAPFVTYPSGQYQHERPEERQKALLAALSGVELGAYDRRILHWLAGWDVPTAATMVSLLWRARHAATPGRG
ncbi:MAG: hypothetical protein ACRDRU_24775 [Pseudonocardiaceae bacterium]